MAKRSKKQSPRPDENNERIADPTVDDDSQWGEISLEELGQAYAEAMASVMGTEPATTDSGTADLQADEAADDDAVNDFEGQSDRQSTIPADEEQDDAIPTPVAIIEAALFIGNPENRGITESELAALMRDVTADDVSEYVDRLNESYVANGQAFRIHRDEDGLRMGVAPDMEVVRRAFYGKIRETRLSQPAIEVLSLVAYQPGITAEKVQDQRGKESASLLSQMVRRRLLELRRVPVEGTKKMVSTYHPTERFLQLFGLESLDDLPQVEP
jgi:segregation and condensation protein B